MSEPIVFISHFRVKDGALEAARDLLRAATRRMEAERPGTVSMAAYLSEDGTTVSIVHVFPDAAAMDAHFEGADQRSVAAYEYILPKGWEIYGSASEQALETMRGEAAEAGVDLMLFPDFAGGFLRAAYPAPQD